MNHELDKVIKKVIICQKIVRGFLCRRRLLHLLESVQQQTIDQEAILLAQITKQQNTSESLDMTNKMDNNNTTTSSNSTHPNNNTKSVDFASTDLTSAPSYGNPEYQNVTNSSMTTTGNNTTKKSTTTTTAGTTNDEYQNMVKKAPEQEYQNITNKNTKTNSKAFTRQPAPEEKIATLKNQIEKQMKTYVKHEDYDEMLKLVKVSQVAPNVFRFQANLMI